MVVFYLKSYIFLLIINIMIKSIQYITIAVLFVIFFEGIFTIGQAFNFENYGIGAWGLQFLIFTAAVTTALRMRFESDQ